MKNACYCVDCKAANRTPFGVDKNPTGRHGAYQDRSASVCACKCEGSSAFEHDPLLVQLSCAKFGQPRGAARQLRASSVVPEPERDLGFW